MTGSLCILTGDRVFWIGRSGSINVEYFKTRHEFSLEGAPGIQRGCFPLWAASAPWYNFYIGTGLDAFLKKLEITF